MTEQPTAEIFIPAIPTDPGDFPMDSFLDEHHEAISLGLTPARISRPFIIIGETVLVILAIHFPDRYDIDPANIAMTTRFAIESSSSRTPAQFSSSLVDSKDAQAEQAAKDKGIVENTQPVALRHIDGTLYALYPLAAASALQPAVLGAVRASIRIISCPEAAKPPGWAPATSDELDLMPRTLLPYIARIPQRAYSSFNADIHEVQERMSIFDLQLEAKRPVELAMPVLLSQVSVDPIVVTLANNLPIIGEFPAEISIDDICIVSRDGSTAVRPDQPWQRNLRASESTTLSFAMSTADALASLTTASSVATPDTRNAVVNMTTVALRLGHFSIPEDDGVTRPVVPLDEEATCQLTVRFVVTFHDGDRVRPCGVYVASGPVTPPEKSASDREAVDVAIRRGAGTDVFPVTVALRNTTIMAQKACIELLWRVPSSEAEASATTPRAGMAVPTMDFSALLGSDSGVSSPDFSRPESPLQATADAHSLMATPVQMLPGDGDPRLTSVCPPLGSVKRHVQLFGPWDGRDRVPVRRGA
ncbi:hypothetical protein J8273_7905 [Carpediemonas membranifera]|uniref:Uncharacterized protein n=1 Tax=Carpediemonas membranifera TaxID=201153 RepID=A0A8J6B0W2_9EUKA|nr:hypothetical protein J8273_7905 [Carpediemonas membranifera]|eukprot:KAG9390554.1 hypothetical protein J8273_7905 [Carpediemonas membranifera]